MSDQTKTPQEKQKSQELAIMKRETADVVADKVRAFQENGELFFPPNYSPENALKSAWLIIQKTEDLQHRKALDVCTKDSIANALLSMVIQGLNPDKKQCYFIVYGNQLTMQRSYFGSIAVAKMANEKVEDIIGDVIYDGDEFTYEKCRGKTIVTKHTQTLDNINKEKIKGAYATILYTDGTEESVIMTLPQIHQAWQMSKTKNFDEKGNLNSSSTHAKFSEEMCKKTVINRAAKMIINTSDDSMILQEYRRTEETLVESAAKERIAANANTEELDIDPDGTEPDGIDPETGEIVSQDYSVDNENNDTGEEKTETVGNDTAASQSQMNF